MAMNASWKNRLPWAAAIALVVTLVVLTRWQPARAVREAESAVSPHYTVVETEGHNLIVTDNHTNMLYFYTIDRDAKIGSDLKLRGSVDLTQVGKPVLKPKKVEKE
jgi:hypothetical protein